jgi:hypothetical protein
MAWQPARESPLVNGLMAFNATSAASLSLQVNMAPYPPRLPPASWVLSTKYRVLSTNVVLVGTQARHKGPR